MCKNIENAKMTILNPLHQLITGASHIRITPREVNPTKKAKIAETKAPALVELTSSEIGRRIDPLTTKGPYSLANATQHQAIVIQNENLVCKVLSITEIRKAGAFDVIAALPCTAERRHEHGKITYNQYPNPTPKP
jgi:hypothetical protein